MDSRQKTIFITITRSFLTRNILRSGTLEHLKRCGYRIIVFFQAKEVPTYLKKEFEDDLVSLHAFTPVPHWFHRRINILKRYLIETHISKLVARFESHKQRTLSSGLITSLAPSLFARSARLAVIKTLGRLPVARRLFRFLEKYVFLQRSAIANFYFDRYAPDVILSTSLISDFDILFLKEASRRGVPTISMPKGWDNVTKEYYPFLPDWFAVPNEVSASCATTLQDMNPARVRAVGLPQFDWYARPEIRLSREEHLRAKGLDPARKLIFFGSEGAWSQNDWRIAELLYEWIKSDALGAPSQLFVRPHYSDVQSPKFDSLRGKPHVFVDDYPKIDFLADRWDPTVPLTIDFTNSILHADVVVNIASSLTLDAASADRPVVLIGFGCEFEGETDVTIPKLYGSDHMRWVADAGGAPRADNPEDLKRLVRGALEEPHTYAAGRARLRERLCYRVDGKSSERLATLLADIVQSTI